MELENIVANTVYLKAREGKFVLLRGHVGRGCFGMGERERARGKHHPTHLTHILLSLHSLFWVWRLLSLNYVFKVYVADDIIDFQHSWRTLVNFKRHGRMMNFWYLCSSVSGVWYYLLTTIVVSFTVSKQHCVHKQRLSRRMLLAGLHRDSVIVLTEVRKTYSLISIIQRQLIP